MSKVIEYQALSQIKTDHPGKTIVHCHGVFDLFHYGHLLHLRSAKKFGDILVVTLTPDRFVNKGPGRPRYTEKERAALLASLDIVDFVAINMFPKANETIRLLKPDFYVKGPDYKNKDADITGGIVEEERCVIEVGGKLVITEDDSLSSTELLNRYFNEWDANQNQVIKSIKDRYSLTDIFEIIENLSNLKVLVVGEPIIDTYVFCETQGLSSKNPNISTKFLSEENYAGGALAIASHLKKIGCDVGLFVVDGGEDYVSDLYRSSLDDQIKMKRMIYPDMQTVRKVRYITKIRQQRLFEVNYLNKRFFTNEEQSDISRQLLEYSSDYDVVIVADFGHGMFVDDILDALKQVKPFLALNVQTNSANFGFNRFTKHEHFNYLSLDEREFRLGVHDQNTNVRQLIKDHVQHCNGGVMSITIGEAGSIFVDKDGTQHECPAFFKQVIDTTGSGDAYFLITSILVYAGVTGLVVPFIGNCYAGLQARIIGNKFPVSKVDLINTIKSILK